MNDKKFTNKEIIKALESALHRHKNVTHHVSCIVDINILKNTLDLINRQKTEIEKLKECPKCVYEYDGEVTEYCVQGPCPNFKTVEQIKAEAYKEFAEKLENEINCRTTLSRQQDKNVIHIIHNLLKEMVGEERMTNEEAIIDIRENIQPIVGGKSLDIAISAIEKQIPKKPTHEATLYKCYTCPNCKNVIDKFEKWEENRVRITYKYCYFCGQALDWSDAE